MRDANVLLTRDANIVSIFSISFIVSHSSTVTLDICLEGEDGATYVMSSDLETGKLSS